PLVASAAAFAPREPEIDAAAADRAEGHDHVVRRAAPDGPEVGHAERGRLEPGAVVGIAGAERRRRLPHVDEDELDAAARRAEGHHVSGVLPDADAGPAALRRKPDRSG